MKAGAIAGIVIGIVLAVIAIIIVVIIAIKKRRASEILVPYSREDIEDKIKNSEIKNTDAIKGLYENIGLGMSDIDKALANQAPINWIKAIEVYNSEIQREEDALKSLTKEELNPLYIENEYCDRENGYPIYIKTPKQFSAMEYLSSSPHLRQILQNKEGNGSYSRAVRDDNDLDTAVKYYYTYKAFNLAPWSDPAGEILIPESSYEKLVYYAAMIADFYKSPYQTFDEYLSKESGVPESDAMDLASNIIDLLSTNPLNNVDSLFIEQWNNMKPETKDIRYNYRLPALYAFDEMAKAKQL